MKLLGANWLITCNEDFDIIENGGVVYDEKIIEVGNFQDLKSKYEFDEIIEPLSNSVLLPGLINSHIHLEFSANKTTLKYGDFMKWLNSVIKNREELTAKLSDELLNRVLKSIIKSGTTTIGAISSYGFELEACVSSPLNVVYFNEVIGSKADMIDNLFADFKSRFKASKEFASSNFYPAIAIHSPYSVHPFLIREVLKMAKDEDCAISAHFLESPDEKEWLERSDGSFVDFFKNFLSQSSSLATPIEFLNQFKNSSKVSFTHCCEASYDEIETIKDMGASINHCPRSNRFLNSNRLDIENIDTLNLSLGTDGLSSNISLSMFDEIRSAMFVHEQIEANVIAKKLLLMSTVGGAKALGLNKGMIKKGMDSDMIFCELPDICEKDDVVLQTLLHTKFVKESIIGGLYVK